MSCLASAVLLTTASRAEDRPAGPAPTTVVQPQDTLWSVASRSLPERDPYSAIAEIRRINDLDGYIVHPGQTLELPR
jgi:LysM repeat protein